MSVSSEARCSSCEGPLDERVKMWTMVGKEFNSDGERMLLTIGSFRCPTCNQQRKVVMAKERVKVLSVDKIREMEVKIMEWNTRKTEFEEKIRSLESEREKLQSDINALRERLEAAELENKAHSLQNELAKLRIEREELEARVKFTESESGQARIQQPAESGYVTTSEPQFQPMNAKPTDEKVQPEAQPSDPSPNESEQESSPSP